MMKSNDELEDDMFESMELMLEAYGLFNQVLKNGNAIDKTMAACLMDSLNKGYKIDLQIREEAAEQHKNEEPQELSYEQKKKEVEKIEQFAEKAKEMENMLAETQKALNKHFPLNNKAERFKKKRNRLRKIRSKKIRD